MKWIRGLFKHEMKQERVRVPAEGKPLMPVQRPIYNVNGIELPKPTDNRWDRHPDKKILRLGQVQVEFAGNCSAWTYYTYVAELPLPGGEAYAEEVFRQYMIRQAKLEQDVTP
jgi:hypothetical protein